MGGSLPQPSSVAPDCHFGGRWIVWQVRAGTTCVLPTGGTVMTMNGMRALVTGRGLVESPRWHADRLNFSDWTAGEVLAVDRGGRGEVIARVRSLPLCTAWLSDGRLVIVSSQEGLLLRLESDGSLVTHAKLGRPGWNDIVADGRGSIYVNGPGFNPMAGEAFRPGGVSHVAPDGSVRQVADDIAFPTGTQQCAILILTGQEGGQDGRASRQLATGEQEREPGRTEPNTG
jgi:hypothetical protein